jgi:hypothetical protein
LNGIEDLPPFTSLAAPINLIILVEVFFIVIVVGEGIFGLFEFIVIFFVVVVVLFVFVILFIVVDIDVVYVFVLFIVVDFFLVLFIVFIVFVIFFVFVLVAGFALGGGGKRVVFEHEKANVLNSQP